MSALDLDPIKARCDAATEGPWKRVGFGTLCYVATPLIDKDMMICTPRLSAVLGDVLPHETLPEQKTEDSNFIAHARTDIPALVAEVERMREHFGEIAAYEPNNITDDMRRQVELFVNIARQALENPDD